MAWEYRLRWDTDPAFSSPDTIDGLTTPSHEITGLQPLTTYYVQVAVREAPDGEWSEWSDAEEATTLKSSQDYLREFSVSGVSGSIHTRRVEYRRGHHLLGLPTALVQQTTSYLRSLLVTGVDAHTYLRNRYYSRRYSVVGEALSPIRRGVSRFIALAGMGTAVARRTYSVIRTYVLPGRGRTRYERQVEYTRPVPVDGVGTTSYRRQVSFSRMVGIAGAGSLLVSRFSSRLRSVLTSGEGQSVYRRAYHGIRRRTIIGKPLVIAHLITSAMVSLVVAGRARVHTLKKLDITYRFTQTAQAVASFIRGVTLRERITSWGVPLVVRHAQRTYNTVAYPYVLLRRGSLRYFVVPAAARLHYQRLTTRVRRAMTGGQGLPGYTRRLAAIRQHLTRGHTQAVVGRNLRKGINILGTGFTTLWRHSVRSVRVLGAGVMHYRTAQVLLRAFRVTAHGITSLSTTIGRVYTYLTGGSGLTQVRRNLRKGITTQGTYLTTLWRHSRFSRRVRGQGSALLTVGLGLIRRVWVRGEAQTPIRIWDVPTLRALAVAVGVPRAIKGIRRSAIVRGVSAVLRRVQLSRRTRFYTTIVHEQIRWTAHTTTRRPYQDE